MANTKAAMDTLVDAFNTYVDADDYANAKKTLLKIRVHRATLPDTEQVRYGQVITACEDLLKELMAESSTYAPKSVLLRRDQSGT